MAYILVIDDDRPIREVMSKWLTIEGHRVETAKNGLDGIDMIRRNSYDLIVTDIIMPERDGYEVIMALRKEAQRPKIIAVSGGSTAISKDVLLSTAGMMADRVMSKPLDYQELSHLIRELLAPPEV